MGTVFVTMAASSSEKKTAWVAFKQQQLPAWQPILTPQYAYATFFIVGAVFLSLGILIFDVSTSGHQQGTGAKGKIVKYNDQASIGSPSVTCTPGSVCMIETTVEEDMAKPVYVYYQLTRFYQNHRRYVTSRSDVQLQGEQISASEARSKCEPRAVCGKECPDDKIDKIYNPCGLVAWSVFNDSYAVQLNKKGVGFAPVDIVENNIAWKSDLDKKFKTTDCPATDYCWLHERSLSFNNTKLPATKTNVDNEHFVVWMRNAALPTFRKLYGVIDEDMNKGDKLRFSIKNNYPTEMFKGEKSIVISTASFIGGPNTALAWLYIIVGAVCLLLAVIFFVKDKQSPRALGDSTYLHWD